ncbi:MAG: SagB/ThcOx family dehydrogenase [Planctomycetota bacterium]
MDDLETAIRYHERTKHHFDRFARSRGYMDWANQPDPFRRYAGAPLLPLPIRGDPGGPRYDAVYDPGALCPHALDLAGLSELLYRSMAISAWKEFQGSRWALRCNPSSGNLHPTEAYLCCPRVAGLSEAPAIYHYAAMEHGLERRCLLEEGWWERLELPADAFLVGFSSIHWREAWKYGERAYRYCQHDLGHALAAMSLAAGSLGWRTRVLDAMGDREIAALLGLDQGDGDAEQEHPDLLLLLYPADFGGELPTRLPAAASLEAARGPWLGAPNKLSPSTVPWEGIAAVETACRKEAEAAGVREAPRAQVGGTQAARGGSARSLFRRRRSAVAFDGRTGLSLETFGRMLGRLLPDPARPPWDAWPHPAALSLVLFVHRVDGLPPGLYCLARPEPGSKGAETSALRAAMREEFLWEKPEKVAADLPLFLLLPMDCRGLAQRLSCDQAIAGMSAFSLGMIAEFEPRIRQAGAWFYRRLFWEAGMIGQVLYLEAEAAGVRATGIGCYYDDPVHELLGLEGRRYQSLYHFTVGGAVDDPRLVTLPAYGSAEDGSALGDRVRNG